LKTVTDLFPVWCDRHQVIEQRDIEFGREPQLSEVSQALPALLENMGRAIVPTINQQPSVPSINLRLLDRVAQLEQTVGTLALTVQRLEQRSFVENAQDLNQSQQQLSAQPPNGDNGLSQVGMLFGSELPVDVSANASQNVPPYAIPALSKPSRGVAISASNQPQSTRDDTAYTTTSYGSSSIEPFYCHADQCGEPALANSRFCKFHFDAIQVANEVRVELSRGL
jgi:hypothetical protein